MPIATKCPKCKALFRLADDLAGQRVRCENCGQLFAVPTPKSASRPAPASQPPATAPVAAPAPAAPTPPISLSLDDPLPALPAPAEAINVEPAKPEVVEAIVVGPPAAAEEIFDATVVEEPAEPARKSGRKPPPINEPEISDRPVRRKRAADLPRHSTAGATALALLGVLLLGALIVAVYSGIWFVFGLGDANKVILPPPMVNQKPLPPMEVEPGKRLLLENGKAVVTDNVPAGGELVYSVFVQQNQRFNLLVAGPFMPNVRVQDGNRTIASRRRDARASLLRAATHRQPHDSHCQSAVRRWKRHAELRPASNMFPMQISLAFNPNFQTERTLQLEDPVSEDFAYGPSHQYLLTNLKPGEKYQIKAASTAFLPVLRLQNGGALIQELYAPPDPECVYTAAPGMGALSIHVVSQGNAFGKYTLQVTRLTEQEKPGPRNVAFDAVGLYHRDERLADDDPLDANLGRVKTYLIAMEKGLGYNIEMKSGQIDAHLSLFDPQGALVAKDDDSGGDYNARILFDPKASGQYRLLAADFRKLTGAYSIDIARVTLPKSTAVEQPLLTAKRREADCDVVEASLVRGIAGQSTFSWSADGKAFFLFDREGWLRRIRYPEFIEDQRMPFPQEQAQIHLTAEGLLVSTTNARELLILDPQNLQLKRRLPRLGSAVLASPTLSHVFVEARFTKVAGAGRPGLLRHDLTKPGMVPFPFLNLPLTTQFLALSPDGKHLFGRKEDRLMRWRVAEKTIVSEEAGTRYFRSWTDLNPPLILSKDGKLLLHPINNRQLPKDDIKPGPASDYGIAGYRSGDFKEPAFVLDTGFASSAAAIDPKTGLVCTFSKTKGFVLADAQGKIVRELPIKTRAGKINQAVTAHGIPSARRQSAGVRGQRRRPEGAVDRNAQGFARQDRRKGEMSHATDTLLVGNRHCAVGGRAGAGALFVCCAFCRRRRRGVSRRSISAIPPTPAIRAS